MPVLALAGAASRAARSASSRSAGSTKNSAHRRQSRRQRIERLLGARRVAQAAKQAGELAMAALHDTQGFECGKRRVARRLQRGLDRGERLGPLLEPRPHDAQGFIRLSDGLHHAVEIRRIEVARDEAEGFQRLQQRRQHGHDVVHHSLTHRRAPCQRLSVQPLLTQCNRGALAAWPDRSSSAPRRR